MDRINRCFSVLYNRRNLFSIARMHVSSLGDSFRVADGENDSFVGLERRDSRGSFIGGNVRAKNRLQTCVGSVVYMCAMVTGV